MGMIHLVFFAILKLKLEKMKLVSFVQFWELEGRKHKRIGSRKGPAALEQERVRRARWGCFLWWLAHLYKGVIIDMNIVIT